MWTSARMAVTLSRPVRTRQVASPVGRALLDTVAAGRQGAWRWVHAKSRTGAATTVQHARRTGRAARYAGRAPTASWAMATRDASSMTCANCSLAILVSPATSSPPRAPPEASPPSVAPAPRECQGTDPAAPRQMGARAAPAWTASLAPTSRLLSPDFHAADAPLASLEMESRAGRGARRSTLARRSHASPGSRVVPSPRRGLALSAGRARPARQGTAGAPKDAPLSTIAWRIRAGATLILASLWSAWTLLMERSNAGPARPHTAGVDTRTKAGAYLPRRARRATAAVTRLPRAPTPGARQFAGRAPTGYRLSSATETPAAWTSTAAPPIHASLGWSARTSRARAGSTLARRAPPAPRACPRPPPAPAGPAPRGTMATACSAPGARC
mmetsp:Transcript_45051/g.143457  ORF Transcript_45051/g.143457 Transcript_45051/m.143457 type:complete len:387 (-) Transcript_45051:2371-3531(-)